ncbi:GNAT family N-acetyltransferase [Phormidesmis sp. 146-33]
MLRFETDRLLIRDWNPAEDAEQAFEIYRDPEIFRFFRTAFSNPQPSSSVESQRERLQKVVDLYAQLNDGTGYWAIVLKTTGEIVGSVILKQLPDGENNPTGDYEVGWHLKKSAWGKGFATEAGRGAIEYGFTTLNLPVIYAVTHPENDASKRVAQRLGMIPQGHTDRYYGVETALFKWELHQ